MTPGTPVEAVCRSADKLDIFCVGSDGFAYTAAWEPAFSDGWHGWWRVGDLRISQGSSIAAVSRAPDTLDIFCVAADGRVFTAAWEPAFVDGWHGWWPVRELHAVAPRGQQVAELQLR